MKQLLRSGIGAGGLILTVLIWLHGQTPAPVSLEVPRAADPRLIVELFAAAPDIVHPIGIDFDSRGRLLVIESHTHFRPANYQGPQHDRIRILEDTKGSGKADRFTTFFEGTSATMDIAVHPDGSVYLATRNEIIRLRDTKNTGKADERQRIVFLDTKGNYPHNGLSGLAFDSKGDLTFGMGENLGAGYKLTGSDGTTLGNEGEGGNIFWCTADGKRLRRVATGFWNPFGVCRDIFGRMFAVDNDPDAMPPCRLVHVVEGGDFGFQFRYGRSGRHPFQSWNGQLPGTLPMMSGVGEAPCEIISYESDGLPKEYVGDLLVASWADHRIERYVVKDQGASYTAQHKPFIQGGKDFRPVGIAVAPDGSLFISDWVLSNYNLHGRGAIWHIRMKEPSKPDRPADLQKALFSAHRPLREAAARQLATQDAGRAWLRAQLGHGDLRARTTALTVLIDSGDKEIDLAGLAEKDPVVPIRALAVKALAGRGEDTSRFLDGRYPPAVRLEAIAGVKGRTAKEPLLRLLMDKDPFIRTAAVQQLARSAELLADIDLRSLADPLQRIGLLLAQRASGRADAQRLVPLFLADADEDVRFLAAKWIADEKLTAFRALLTEALLDPKLNVRLFFACASALARLDNRDVSESKMADFFLPRLIDDKSAPAVRIMALQMVPANHKQLTLDLLTGLLRKDDPALQVEAVRTLIDHPSAQRGPILLEVARNSRLADPVRAQALAGLADRAQDMLDEMLTFARSDNGVLRMEALRALVGTKLREDQRAQLAKIAQQQPATADLTARVLGTPFFKNRPAADNLDAWLQRLAGPADASAGRRIFFHAKLAGCNRCHRVEGRGKDIGPDLSTIGRTDRRHILESILLPDNVVPPHYQVWVIITKDGRSLTGMLMHTQLDEYTYVDAKGELFKLNTRDIAESQTVPKSIMPTGLADLLTDQEMRDLLAYLEARR